MACKAILMAQRSDRPAVAAAEGSVATEARTRSSVRLRPERAA